MPSIYNAQDNAVLIERIESLTVDSQRQWGKMTVEQMLVHCARPIDVATGRATLKRGLMAILFGRMIKRMLLRPRPYKTNMPTAPDYIIKGAVDINNAKKELITRVQEIAAKGSAIFIPFHPMFGPMTGEECDEMHWKHLDHHLRQFSA